MGPAHCKEMGIITITYEDFRNFLKLGTEEHQNLDYKSGELLVGPNGKFIGKDGKLTNSPDVDKGFEALAKAVAGFAYAEGDY